MNALAVNPPAVRFTSQPSEAARVRMRSRRGEALFLAGWKRVLMLHLEVDAVSLQRSVPFPLDLYHGRAFVSLVAFTMEGMRPHLGGRWAARLFQPIATHDFLNVRTYVVHHGEPGIHFMAEWLNGRLAVLLGPTIFGLPYRHGRLDYDLDWRRAPLQGRVADTKTGAGLDFHGELAAPGHFSPAEEGSLTEWLMERYTAFNTGGGRRRYFRVWHPPWPQANANMQLGDRSLLTKNWPCFEAAELIGANYSPGFDAVWMGRPRVA